MASFAGTLFSPQPDQSQLFEKALIDYIEETPPLLSRQYDPFRVASVKV